MHHLIIGGSDAGISAALRLRELAPADSVTMLLADDYPNYSICGIPFYLSQEVSHLTDLAHRTRSEIEAAGISVLTRHRAIGLQPEHRRVLVEYEKAPRTLTYDRLLIATGGQSMRPALPGLDEPGVFTLRWIGDMLAIEEHIQTKAVQDVVIVGGGYIGLEVADALTLRGLRVTLLEKHDQVLTTLDQPLSELVRAELETHGIRVQTNTVVQTISSADASLRVQTTDGRAYTAQLVIVAVGAVPETTLARQAGIALNDRGAIRTDQKMATSQPHIWAAGDCVETWHALLNKPVYIPLGTTAHKQGRLAGENMAGFSTPFAGTLGTQSVKLFDAVAARTGLNDADCRREGIDAYTHATQTSDHKAYYPGAHPLHIRLTGEPATGRLLGMQLVGTYGTEVSKRVDTVATALHHGLTVAGLLHLDLSYTPPLSSPWDPVQLAAMAWLGAVDKLAA